MLNVWSNVAFGIQYSTNATSADAAMQKKATSCQSFIAVLHEIIGYAKYRYQHRRKKGGNADGTGADSDHTVAPQMKHRSSATRTMAITFSSSRTTIRCATMTLRSRYDD